MYRQRPTLLTLERLEDLSCRLEASQVACRLDDNAREGLTAHLQNEVWSPKECVKEIPKIILQKTPPLDLLD
jgi:hypothetical protein